MDKIKRKGMIQDNSAIGWIIIIILLGTVFVFLKNQDPVKIQSVTLKPTTIKESDYALITVNLRNVDNKAHDVRIRFNVPSKLTIYEGTDTQLPNNNGIYYYDYHFGAAIIDEDLVFSCTGKKDSESLSTNYEIKIELVVDGELLTNSETKTITIT